MATAAKSNVTKVQVPGEASAPAPDQAANLPQGQVDGAEGSNDAGAGAADPLTLDSDGSEGATVVDVDALQAQLAAQADELAQLKAALANGNVQPEKKAGPLRPGAGGRSDFTHVSASQIDVATLKRPIQTRDGWLVPEKITHNDKG